MTILEKLGILVTAVAGDIGGSAVRVLTGVRARVVGCDMNDLCSVRTELSGFYRSPPAADGSVFVDFLLNLVKAEGVRFLLPISEPEIQALRAARAQFDEIGVRLLLNNEEVLSHFTDKLCTVRYMQELGIKVPRTALMSEYDGTLGFPVIVKPRKGCGSKRLWTAECTEDIEYLRRKDDGTFIVQELVGSEDAEYTTGVFSDGNHVSHISFRRKLGLGGLSTEARFVEETQLSELSEKIARAVNLVGSINIQTRRHGDTFVPFEVNPRLSSTLPFRTKFGFDEVMWWINALCGNGYSYKPKYVAGTAIRCVSEHYFDLEHA